MARHRAYDSIGTLLAADHAIGSGTLTLPTGYRTDLQPTANAPVFVMVADYGAVDDAGRAINPARITTFEATARVGDVLTVAPIAGQTDQAYAAGSKLLAPLLASHINELQGAGPDHRTFGCFGTPVVNAYTPVVSLDRAVTCAGVTADCAMAPSGGPATMELQQSADGVTWTTLASVSIADGQKHGTATCTTSLAAGTRLRGKYTAVNGATNVSATLSFTG